ncbi:MAG: ammonium transporter [Clostridia bacterium]|nr:ammonium transporter [Clostridia bacterium]
MSRNISQKHIIFYYIQSNYPALLPSVRANAGSELKVDEITTLAFLNTDIAASFAAITWLIIEWVREGKPKFVGLLTGAVAGLATITPTAGFVPLWAAIIIGISAGAVCYLAVQLKNKLGWDDALDVWGVHGIGGLLGTILLARIIHHFLFKFK